MPELTPERIDQLVAMLTRARESRMDDLPDRGALIEIIADAMNALEIAYIMLAEQAERTPPTIPQANRPTFVSVSKPNEPKAL